jgi:beta-mannosidase
MRPDVPYVDCSTTASPVGARADDGPTHYFGVGGYLRPVTDIRRSQVRFATECLAFGHVPEDRTLAAVLPAGAGVVQHPAWKLAMPRDAGAGWDFDDVREHYLRELFGADPVRLRWEDPARYLEASRVTTGAIMAQAIAEMRASGSPCAGALIWTLSDLVPGAGWGLIDATGRRKAAWYFARRAFTSRLQLTDEGLNGLRLHAINEAAEPLDAHLRMRFFRDGEVVVATGERDLTVPPRQTVGVDVDLLLGRFFDSACAYRFGPPGYDFATAELIDRTTGARIGEASFFPGKLPLDRRADPALSAQLQLDRPGSALLSLRSARLAYWVALDAGAWLPDDNYFHLAPGTQSTVRLSGPAGEPPPEVTLLPFNSTTSLRVRPAEGRTDAAR